MIRSAPPASADLAIRPELLPAPMIGRPWSSDARSRARICARVNGRVSVTAISLRSDGSSAPGRGAQGLVLEGPGGGHDPLLDRDALDAGRPDEALSIGLLVEDSGVIRRRQRAPVRQADDLGVLLPGRRDHRLGLPAAL